MATVLSVATVAYAIVLVLALAISLVTIWLSLRGVASGLRRVGDALADVSRLTATLNARLAPLRDPCPGCAGELAGTAELLERAQARLAAIVGNPR